MAVNQGLVGAFTIEEYKRRQRAPLPADESQELGPWAGPDLPTAQREAADTQPGMPKAPPAEASEPQPAGPQHPTGPGTAQPERAARTPARAERSSKEPPYKGLASFQLEDAGWFFGREDLTRQLAALASADGPLGSPGVPVVLVGPSGSGKSSLLRAGLIPALRAVGDRPLALFTPGAAPLATLARQLARLNPAGTGAPAERHTIETALRADPASAASLVTAAPADRRAIIIVDQFEEVFTACSDEAERQCFITAICALPGAALVTLALRADFYDRVLGHPELARALQERQIVAGPMSTDELRRAITQPARLARLKLENGLVEEVLRSVAPARPDAVPGAGHEAGILPLISHALLATWSRRHKRRLTIAGYQASGGIEHALGWSAEQAWNSVTGDDKDLARQLLLRMVTVTENYPPTCRPLRLADLSDWPAGRPAAAILAPLTEARLVSVHRGVARITHEALLTGWPLLRSWIDDDQAGLPIRQRVAAAARAWDTAGQDSSALLRGGQLAIAQQWAADPVNSARLTPLDRYYVRSGTRLETQHHDAQRRRAALLRRLVAVLAAAVLAALGLAGYSLAKDQAATTAGAGAVTAARQAQSRLAAMESDQVRKADPALAAQLSLAAYALAPTQAARSSLLTSAAGPAADRLADTAGPVQAISLSPDHRVLAVAGADGSLRLWNMAGTAGPVPLGGPLPGSGPLDAVAFSPDGSILATAGTAKTITLWDIRHPAQPAQLGEPLRVPAAVDSLAFSPRTDLLAAGFASGTVGLWDTGTDARPHALGTLGGPGGAVRSVVFSADGVVLAAGSAGGEVRLWALGAAAPAVLGAAPAAASGGVGALAFSPRSGMLAVGSRDGSVSLWAMSSGGVLEPDGALPGGGTAGLNAIAFSPAGTTLAAAYRNGQVRVWNVRSLALAAALPHGGQPVTTLSWDGTSHLITGDAAGLIRVWALPSPVLQAGGPVRGVAYSPGGAVLAAGGTSLQLWDPATHTLTARAAVPGPPGTIVSSVSFARTGDVLAAAYSDGMIQLWHAAPGSALVPLSSPLTASARGRAEAAAFSPDGRLLVSAGADGTVRLWSVTDPAKPEPLPRLSASRSEPLAVAFSNSGDELVVTSADGRVRLWGIDGTKASPAGGQVLAGPGAAGVTTAFSPGDRVLAVGTAGGTVQLWNVASPARAVPLSGTSVYPAGRVYSVAFSPDGRTLAAGSTGGVWVWDVASPAAPQLASRPATASPAASAAIYSVAYSADGQTLAAGGADGSVRLWATTAGAAQASLCAAAGQPLSSAEWAAYLPGAAYRAPCPPGTR